MGKSLTETAKAVLMKEEGSYPSVSPMGAGSPERDVKSTTPAKSSLKPGSPEGQIVNPGANSTTGNQAQDLGAALVKNTDVPPSAKAAGSVKKDSSRSAKSNVAAEPAKKQMEVMEEDVELEEDMDLNKQKEGKEIAKRAGKLRANRPEGVIKDFGNLISRRKMDDAVTGGDTAADSEKAMRQLYGKDKRWKGAIEKITVREEALEEEIELSEELEAFIDEMIEEGYDEDQIAEAIEENFEIVEAKSEDEEDEEDEDENEDKEMNESSLEDYQVDMSEDVDALFAGEELSEDFKNKATTIFEAAVKRKLEEEIQKIEEAYAQTLEEQVASIQEELSSNVDDYLNYVVEQWMSENEVAVEAGLRTELTEDFISGLKALFEEHYIDIPEEKVSVVEELGNKVSELEAKLNEEIERSVALNKMLNESRKVEVLSQMVEGLTATQADKLKTLAEGVTFDNVDEYAQKVATLRESYFPTSGVNAPRELDSIEAGTEGKSMIAEELNGPMAKYVRALGKTLPN
jgi:AcrR family transcriptional regulator